MWPEAPFLRRPGAVPRRPRARGRTWVCGVTNRCSDQLSYAGRARRGSCTSPGLCREPALKPLRAGTGAPLSRYLEGIAGRQVCPARGRLPGRVTTSTALPRLFGSRLRNRPVLSWDREEVPKPFNVRGQHGLFNGQQPTLGGGLRRRSMRLLAGISLNPSGAA